MGQDRAAEVAGEQGHALRRLHGLYGRRAGLAAEHGELAEDVPLAEVGERDLAPVGVAARDAHGAAPHHVAGVAGVALAEDHLAREPAARYGHLGKLGQLAF